MSVGVRVCVCSATSGCLCVFVCTCGQQMKSQQLQAPPRRVLPPQQFTRLLTPSTNYLLCATYVHCVWCPLWSVGWCGGAVVPWELLLAATAHKLQLHTHLPVLNCLTTNTK